jgi:hypothetical protein
LVLHERPAWIDPVDCPRCLAYKHARVKLVVRSAAPAVSTGPG